jgi:dihydrofolate reductase
VDTEQEADMGRIVLSDNVTLDGVIEDPAGDEGFRLGGWVGMIKDKPQLSKLALGEALEAQAWLLGRRSYEWFAARWPSRTGELADRLNALPKYVVSATLKNPRWTGSTVLRGNPIDTVSTLKQQIAGTIIVPASFQLARTLLEHDLVDELRLKVFPIALGAGERLFGQTSHSKSLRLIDMQTVESGIITLTYQATPNID